MPKIKYMPKHITLVYIQRFFSRMRITSWRIDRIGNWYIIKADKHCQVFEGQGKSPASAFRRLRSDLIKYETEHNLNTYKSKT